jgi:hypothetical protein
MSLRPRSVHRESHGWCDALKGVLGPGRTVARVGVDGEASGAGSSPVQLIAILAPSWLF